MGDLLPELQKMSYAFQNKLVDFQGEGLYILVPGMRYGVHSFMDGTWERVTGIDEIERYVKRWGRTLRSDIQYLYKEMLEVLE